MAYSFPNGNQDSFYLPGDYNIPRWNPQGAPYEQNPYSYFNWNTNYGGDRDWVNTPAVGGPGGYLENTPEALYTMWTSPWAGGENPFSKYVQSQYSDVYGGYKTAFATNPEMVFKDFLQTLSPYFFANRYNALTPRQRGESNSLYGAGKMQWLL